MAAVSILFTTASVKAATEAEMDRARAIAAKYYVRNARTGSGYLDKWEPASMSELEKKINSNGNSEDKSNFAAFKALAVTGDYASWGKPELQKYWETTFFANNASGLKSDVLNHAFFKSSLKTALGKISATPVAASAPAAPAAAEPAPAEEPTPAETSAAEAEIDAEMIAEAAKIDEAQQIVAQEEEKNKNGEGGSGTWVYIMVLAILVAVVIFLVIYASRTMKGQAKTKAAAHREEEPEVDHEAYQPKPVMIEEEPKRRKQKAVEEEPARRNGNIAEETRMREKFAETLASKSEEIRALTRQLSEMEALAARLREENRKLQAENERLRKDAETRIHRPAPVPRQEEEHRQSRPQRQAPREREPQHHNEVHEVYLGRVNSRGIFVRADRHAVEGQSIFKLQTSNGVSGTYTLLTNPLIVDQMLEDPGKWLAGGCFAKDIFDTDDRTGIRTETPGTAVFRDGAWRVEKKAKIRYE